MDLWHRWGWGLGGGGLGLGAGAGCCTTDCWALGACWGLAGAALGVLGLGTAETCCLLHALPLPSSLALLPCPPPLPSSPALLSYPPPLPALLPCPQPSDACEPSQMIKFP